MRGALLEVKGYVWWELARLGHVLQNGEGPNLIVDDGLEWIAGRLQNAWGTWNHIESMKAGNGDAYPTSADSALDGALYAEEDTDYGTDQYGDLGGYGINSGAANTVLWRAQFTHPGSVATIEEIGLFTSDDVMLARFKTGTIAGMAAGDTITVAWAITVGILGA